jgi:hypothetical protein
MRALAIAALIAALLPPSAAATDLMAEDSRVFGDMQGSPLSEAGYGVAGQMGVKLMRYHRGLEPGREALYHQRVEAWLGDVVRHGFEPYLAISYQPDFYGRGPTPERFARWCGEVARAYGDRISRFAVWNEPNNPKWGPFLRGRPDGYNALFGACRSAIDAATGGTAKVYYGEIDASRRDPCSWVEDSLDGGGVTVADGIAIHTYQWTAPPARRIGTWCQGIGRVDDWNLAKRSWFERGLIRTPAGGEPPLLITEHGYCAPHGECPPTASGADSAIHSEERRAELIRDAFLLARSRGVEVFGLYHLFNQPNGPDPTWDTGILDATTAAPTPSVCALRDLTAVRLLGVAPALSGWESPPAGCH